MITYFLEIKSPVVANRSKTTKTVCCCSKTYGPSHLSVKLGKQPSTLGYSTLPSSPENNPNWPKSSSLDGWVTKLTQQIMVCVYVVLTSWYSTLNLYQSVNVRFRKKIAFSFKYYSFIYIYITRREKVFVGENMELCTTVQSNSNIYLKW